MSSCGGQLKSSRFICIRDAPLDWNEEKVISKFCQYGPVEEVTIETPFSASPHLSQGQKGQVVIIEFENDSDADAAVEDSRESLADDFRVTLYFPPSKDSSSYVYLDAPKETSQNLQPSANFVSCSNSNCTSKVMVEGEKIYCTPDCYFDCIDMTNRVNIYDKWISSMGRSGTGMLEGKLDEIIVTVNSEGVRSSVIKSRNTQNSF